MEVKDLLVEEIVSEIGILKGMDIGTNEYKTAVDGLTKLVDRANEMEKLDIEAKAQQTQLEDREFENDLKLRQMDEERKDRIVRNSIAAAGVLIPAVLTVWGTIVSLNFEKEGTVTTIVGRGFINKIFSKK